MRKSDGNPAGIRRTRDGRRDGSRKLLERLFEAGVNVRRSLTGIQGYLLANPDMLRSLLARGMSRIR